ncbi:MAG: hypothetical protein IJB45_08930 [Clostridia bacterium]|nr:hypothetical protein [Clostridia bacterium]
MKKAKNEATENNIKSAENKQKNKSAENTPSEKSKGKEKSERDLPFKKVLYGYDPEEVAAYIDELAETLESSTRLHESKLSSIKEELVLSNRERDSYGEKYRACMAKLEEALKTEKTAETAPAVEEKQDRAPELEAVIETLKNKLEKAESENVKLREMTEQKTQNAFDEYLSKIAALEGENKQISVRADALRRENSELLADCQKYDGLFGEYNEILAQLEKTKAELAAKQEEAKLLNEELEEKLREAKALSAEKESIKKKAAELEVKNDVLRQKLEENESEIIRLKDANKAQAFECADKVNALESENAKNKLALQKELQLHDYYINQAELTLAQLSKQMEQIKQSLSEVKED